MYHVNGRELTRGCFEVLFLDSALKGKATKWNCFITTGVEMIFALSIVALNSKGPKLIKNPLCLLAAFLSYCGYFVVFKAIRPHYEFSPYHKFFEQYFD